MLYRILALNVLAGVLSCGNSPKSEEAKAKTSLEKIVHELEDCDYHSDKKGSELLRYNAEKMASTLTPVIGTIFISHGGVWEDTLVIRLGWREGKWEFDNAKGTSLFGNKEPVIVNIQQLDQKDENGVIWNVVSGTLKRMLSEQTCSEDM